VTETAGKELSPEWYAINHAAESQRSVLYTPSVLEAAATALTDALAALSRIPSPVR